MNARLIVSLGLIGACLAACGTASKQPEPGQIDSALREVTGQNGRACVYINDIQGFGTLSDAVLSVSARQRTHYLMVTFFRCPSVSLNPAAAFKGGFSEFCGGGRDSVYAGETPCKVRSVFEFENRDAAFAAHEKALEMINGPDDEPEAEDGK